MKKLLFIPLLLLYSAYCKAETADDFLVDNPFDINAGADVFSYAIDVPELQKTGHETHFAAEIGWRYSIIRTELFALGPRIALGGGYWSTDNEYSGFDIQLPLTLNAYLGTGASSQSRGRKFGIMLGGGLSMNYYNYTHTIGLFDYQTSKWIAAPMLALGIRFGAHEDGCIWGIQPSYRWYGQDREYSLRLTLEFGEL